MTNRSSNRVDSATTYLDEIAYNSLASSSLLFAGISLFFCALHLSVVYGQGDLEFLPMARMTLFSGVVLLSIGLLCRAERIPKHLAHRFMFVTASCLAANIFVHTIQLQDLKQTTMVLILLVGYGCFFFSYRWAFPVYLITLGLWVWFAFGYQGTESLYHYSYSVFTASVVGITALVSRIRVHTRLVESRWREEEQRIALQLAYERTHKSEERFRRLTDASSEGVVFHEGETIVDVNRAFCELLGAREEILSQESLLNYIDALDRDRVAQSWSAEESAMIAVTARDMAGKTFPAEMTSTRYFDSGTPLHLSVLRDVTEHRRMEESLRRAKDKAESASRAKSEFLANMSHEIRTPMNGIIGMASLLEYAPLDLEHQEMVRTIRSSGEDLLKILNEILDLSSIESGRLSMTPKEFLSSDFFESVEGLFAPQVKKKGLIWNCSVSPDLPRVICADSSRLRQILNNLLNNAVKFTSKGAVKLHVDFESKAPAAGCLRMVVSDSGIGIAEENIAKLFKPFSQVDMSASREFGGTGLGLSISSRLCRMMGGEITVESSVGEGSQFTAWVEVGIPEVGFDISKMAGGSSVNESELDTARLRILVVEDLEVNRAIAVSMVKRLGHMADSVVSGAAAIKKVEAERFDVVLMDIRMPEMDGFEATQLIRQSSTVEIQPKIVALTADAFDSDKARCQEVGMDGFLAKPVRYEGMQKILEAIHGGSRFVDVS